VGLGLATLDVLVCATVALLLQMFVFWDGPLYVPDHPGEAGRLIWGHLALTAVCVVLTILLLLVDSSSAVLCFLSNILAVVWGGKAEKYSLRDGRRTVAELNTVPYGYL